MLVHMNCVWRRCGSFVYIVTASDCSSVAHRQGQSLILAMYTFVVGPLLPPHECHFLRSNTQTCKNREDDSLTQCCGAARGGARGKNSPIRPTRSLPLCPPWRSSTLRRFLRSPGSCELKHPSEETHTHTHISNEIYSALVFM